MSQQYLKDSLACSNINVLQTLNNMSGAEPVLNHDNRNEGLTGPVQ